MVKRAQNTVITLLCLMISFIAAEEMAQRTNTGAILELKDKIWHGAGQAGITGFDGFENYWNIAPDNQKPNLFTDYYDTWNMNERWSLELKRELLKYHRQGYYVIPQFGVNIFYIWQQYLDGSQDDELDNLIKGLKYLAIPVFIRIGYEFNNFPGEPWLTPFTPEQYQEVFRVFAKKLKESGLEVACVFNASLSGNLGVMGYYPGDEWVDWLGYNTFSDISGGAHPLIGIMNGEAAARKKPVMIGEASPMVVNGVTYGDWGWFNTYFGMIKGNPPIKQMCYINWDWDVQDMVGGNGMFPWGDARLQMPGSVKDQYFQTLSDPAYLHACSEKETRSYFFYNDSEAPPTVTNVKRDGEFLTWNKVEDKGESGLAHYTIYKNGKLWDYIIGEKYPVHDLHQGYDANVQVSAMDRAGNESGKSASLKVELVKKYELLWDGEFDYPATSAAVDWKWMGSQDGNGKSPPDDVIIDTTGKLSGKYSCILPDYQIKPEMNNWWRSLPKEYPKDWKVQLFQSFNVEKDQEYTISFQAVAKEARTIKLYFMDHHVNPDHTHFPAGRDPLFDEEWEFYKIWDVEIGTTPRSYKYKWAAPHSECARLSFMMGKVEPTTIWIDAISVRAEVDLKAPVAVAGEDRVVMDNDNNGVEKVDLDGSKSSDEDGTIVSYSWQEQGKEIAKGAKVNVTLDLGIHPIVLVVTDNHGVIGKDSVEIVVTNGSPIARIDGSVDKLVDFDANGKEDITLDGSSSRDFNGSIASYKWTLNGTQVGTDKKVSLSLESGKTHQIALIVTDNENNTGKMDKAIMVCPEIARNATVTVSSTSDGKAEHIIDADANSFWLSNYSKTPEWALFDLKGQHDVGMACINWTDEHAANYELQGSNSKDFTDFTVISSVKDGQGGIDTVRAKKPVKCQYVRLHTTSGNPYREVFKDSSGYFKAIVMNTSSPTITFVPKDTAEHIYLAICQDNYYLCEANTPYRVSEQVSNIQVGNDITFKYKYLDKTGTLKFSEVFTFKVGSPPDGFYYGIKDLKLFSGDHSVSIIPTNHIQSTLPKSMNFSAIPNRANKTIKLQYSLPEKTHVKISLYSLNGKLVNQIINAPLRAGAHQMQWNSSHLPSGIYLFRIEAGKRIKVHNCAILK